MGKARGGGRGGIGRGLVRETDANGLPLMFATPSGALSLDGRTPLTAAQVDQVNRLRAEAVRRMGDMGYPDDVARARQTFQREMIAARIPGYRAPADTYRQEPIKGLRIRAATYRGRQGFVVYGKGGGTFGVSIFTGTRASAERIRDRLARGLDVRSSDYTQGKRVE